MSRVRFWVAAAVLGAACLIVPVAQSQPGAGKGKAPRGRAGPLRSGSRRDVGMSTVAELFALAVRRHQAGHLVEAEQLYRHVLQVDPSHVVARHLLGVVALQTGRDELATQSFRETLRLRPDFAQAHFNLGNALAAQGQTEEAADSYRQALRWQPLSFISVSTR